MQLRLKIIGAAGIIYILGGCSVTNIKVKDSKGVEIKTKQHDEFKTDTLRVNMGRYRNRGNTRELEKEKIQKNK